MNEDQPVNSTLNILGNCETEILDAIASSFEPMTAPDPPPLADTIYNFNAILDAEGGQ
ncbi:hypothetical protein I8752_22625 [Nostocaceae cyanobacterium CENA369]|uniref:Uncharacterized protein n=1 Tax=Dendronalium phyllosphericum CENA369 TaxID=1725256 RepID=A0A8J7I7P7_9NOST|nr:hypothetical protein [Dendronalium phyllosphericum]MBH8575748.1 hypothetical protein [Dendronalium phyllosphericum CENA369]